MSAPADNPPASTADTSSVSNNHAKAPSSVSSPSRSDDDSAPTPFMSDPEAPSLGPTAPNTGDSVAMVISGLGAMNEHCRELEMEAFLDELVPGPDPSECDFKNFKEGLGAHAPTILRPRGKVKWKYPQLPR